jgi:hypothetical protein
MESQPIADASPDEKARRAHSADEALTEEAKPQVILRRISEAL